MRVWVCGCVCVHFYVLEVYIGSVARKDVGVPGKSRDVATPRS